MKHVEHCHAYAACGIVWACVVHLRTTGQITRLSSSLSWAAYLQTSWIMQIQLISSNNTWTNVMGACDNKMLNRFLVFDCLVCVADTLNGRPQVGEPWGKTQVFIRCHLWLMTNQETLCSLGLWFLMDFYLLLIRYSFFFQLFDIFQQNLKPSSGSTTWWHTTSHKHIKTRHIYNNANPAANQDKKMS